MPFSINQLFWASRLFNQGISLRPLSQNKITTEDFIDRFRSFDDTVIVERAYQEGENQKKEVETERLIHFLEVIVSENNKNSITMI